MATEPTGQVLLPADALAAAVAPALDRIRLAAMRSNLAAGLPQSVLDFGLEPSPVYVAAYLRNTYPDRTVPRASVRAVFTYQPDRDVDADLDAVVASGMAEEPSPGTLRLTAAGRAAMADVHVQGDTVIRALWADRASDIAALAPLVQRCLDAAAATGGATFEALAPGSLPDSVSAAGVLAEQLSGLRWHRFDSHIAAWQHAGLTAAEISALPPGEAREQIERDTNHRAAAPYRALTDTERLRLLAGLAALPG